MRYAEAFRYPFESPRWVPNLLILSIAGIVPLIGPMFALGYAARVMESLRHGVGSGTYHDLDFDQAGDYLLRGLKIFVVTLALFLLVLPLYLALFLGFFLVVPLIGGGIGGSQEGTASMVAGVLSCLGAGVGILLFLALVVVLLMVSVPLVLRASLHPLLGAAFSPSFVLDYVRRCWKQTLLTYLLFMAVSIPISLAGMLLFIVGILVASAYMQLVHAHLLAQLADLYEASGGEPVAGPQAAPAAPPPPPMLPAG
ncbi:MAG TPA: DUF4013 domain-containing protein [Thermoanaerobaculia bacterium]|nr:DUF4013 domain-containing protein [Thermoanaerobaculia bacterium]